MKIKSEGISLCYRVPATFIGYLIGQQSPQFQAANYTATAQDSWRMTQEGHDAIARQLTGFNHYNQMMKKAEPLSSLKDRLAKVKPAATPKKRLKKRQFSW